MGAARVQEYPPVVTAPQRTDREVVGLELVDARRKPVEIPADDVNLDVEKRAGAGGAPERHLAARVGPALGDTDRREQAGHVFQARDLFAGQGYPRFRQRGKQGCVRLWPSGGERSSVQVRIGLEGARHVLEVEVVGIRPDPRP